MMPRTLGIGLAAATVLLAAGCGDDGLSPARSGPTYLEAVSPAGGATSVTVDGRVTVTFSHPMMAGMEMLAALHEGPATGPAVDGQWSWSADRTRLTFAPAQPLKPASQYTLHVGGGMKDAQGRVIDMQQHGTHMGGEWVAGGPMQGGGWMGGGMMSGGASHVGPGWEHANGSFGMVFSFTTSG